jgi:NitT/TauT family transport system substrate-binding protein
MHASADQAPTAHTTRTVRLGVVADILDYSPIWYAERHGLFAAAGIEVILTTTYNVAAATEKLLTGDFDVAITSPDSVLAQNGARPDQVMIAGITNRPMFSLVGGPAITKPEHLIGATLGASSASEGTSILMLEMLGLLGVDTAEVRIEPVGVGEVRVGALREGTIDAGLLNPPLGRGAGGGGLHVLGEVADLIPKYQFITVNARTAWLADPDHADAVRALLQALATAVVAVYDPANAEAMIALTAERMRVEPELARQGWAEFTRLRPVALDLRVDPISLAKNVAVMRHAGTLAQAEDLDLSRLIDHSFLPA